MYSFRIRICILLYIAYNIPAKKNLSSVYLMLSVWFSSLCLKNKREINDWFLRISFFSSLVKYCYLLKKPGILLNYLLFIFRVFMLLSCIGQRSLSNTGVLESLLNLLDNLLSPLQPQLPIHRCSEGTKCFQNNIRFFLKKSVQHC